MLALVLGVGAANIGDLHKHAKPKEKIFSARNHFCNGIIAAAALEVKIDGNMSVVKSGKDEPIELAQRKVNSFSLCTAFLDSMSSASE